MHLLTGHRLKVTHGKQVTKVRNLEAKPYMDWERRVPESFRNSVEVVVNLFLLRLESVVLLAALDMYGVKVVTKVM